ncbi:MAG: hypothetical protein ACRCVV_22190 [Shewanella sp.]
MSRLEGRLTGTKNRQITARINIELYKRIAQEAADKGVSVSDLVRMKLEATL